MNCAAPFTCLALLLALAPAVFAQQGGSGDGGQPPPRRAPPPEAYTACEGKTAGATVTITLRDGRSIEGVCELHGDRLAARPLHPPGGRPGGDGSMQPPDDGGRGFPGSGSSSGS